MALKLRQVIISLDLTLIIDSKSNLAQERSASYFNPVKIMYLININQNLAKFLVHSIILSLINPLYICKMPDLKANFCFSFEMWYLDKRLLNLTENLRLTVIIACNFVKKEEFYDEVYRFSRIREFDFRLHISKCKQIDYYVVSILLNIRWFFR